MYTEIVSNFGVPIATLLIILKLILDFVNGLNRKKEDKQKAVDCVNPLPPDLIDAIWEVKKGNDKLLDMHEKYDEDGTPLWYNRKSVSERILKTLEELLTIMNKTNITLEYFINKEK